jgi:hypothetical protein
MLREAFFQVNYLRTIESSLKSNLSMTTLNKKANGSQNCIYYSRIENKANGNPPMIIGYGLSFAELTISRRKSALNFSSAAPYIATRHHMKLTALLRTWSLI